MPKRIVAIVLLGAALVWTGAASGQESLADVENAITAAWDQLATAACRIELNTELLINGDRVPGRGAGTLEFRRHEGVNLANAHVNGSLMVPIGTTTAELPQNITAVFDGGVFHLMTVLLRVPFVMQEDASKEPAIKKPMGKLLFDGLRDAGTVRLLPQQSVGTTPAYAVESKFKEVDRKAALPAASVRMFFDRNTKLPLLVQVFNSGGKEIGKLTFGGFRLNPELPMERFRFTPPPDAQFLDFSEAGAAFVPQLP
ncbi:MAG: hypothetical protein GY851_25020 [bacterium]|nr:hypothetical protein [bacterium]